MRTFESNRARSAPIAERHQPEQVAQRRNEGSDVGQRGGVEHVVHAGDFFAGLNDVHLLQNNFGAARSIEFHWQRDQLENGEDQIAINSERDQARDAEPKTADDDERQKLRSDLGDWHDRHACLERRVRFGVLYRMPGFVGRDPKSSYRRRVVNIARKAKLLLCRIVVVAEEIVCLHNIDIVDLRGLQNLARALRASDVRACPDFSPSIERTGDTNLRPDSKNCRNNQVKKEVMTAETDWIEQSCFKCNWLN